MAWGLIVLLLVVGGLAIGLGHSVSQRAEETAQPRPILLWFETGGIVDIDERRSRLTRWQDPWRLALVLNPQAPVRIGADDSIPFAVVDEAMAEAWRQRMPDIGYAIDQNGQALVLSRLVPADIQPPGPHILSIDADGRMTLDDTPVDERAIGEWLKLSAVPGYPRGAGTPIELKVDQLTTYGSVRRVLTVLAANGPRRIVDFGQGSKLVRQLQPAPPEHPIATPNCPQPSKLACR